MAREFVLIGAVEAFKEISPSKDEMSLLNLKPHALSLSLLPKIHKPEPHNCSHAIVTSSSPTKRVSAHRQQIVRTLRSYIKDIPSAHTSKI